MVVTSAVSSSVDGTIHCFGYRRGQSSTQRSPCLRPVDTVRVNPLRMLERHQASCRVWAPDTVRTVRTNRVAKRDQCLLDLLQIGRASCRERVMITAGA